MRGYTEVGCYADQAEKWSTDPKTSDAIRGKVKMYDSATLVKDCYNRALTKRNSHFAIKNNTDCYTSSVAHETYGKHGPANGCIRGRGGEDIITVYKLLPRDNVTALSKTITSISYSWLRGVYYSRYLTRYIWRIHFKVVCISISEKIGPKI